jgi:hypothetical protein
MASFDPVSAAFGGALIGLAATALIFINGRIAGISGIVGEALLAAGGRSWRIAFLAGLVAAPVLLGLAGRPMAEPQLPGDWIAIAAGGLLVGFGTRLGGGCTSGHGVCGIARFSTRSIAATLMFMAAAFAIVAIVRHGLRSGT